MSVLRDNLRIDRSSGPDRVKPDYHGYRVTHCLNMDTATSVGHEMYYVASENGKDHMVAVKNKCRHSQVSIVNTLRCCNEEHDHNFQRVIANEDLQPECQTLSTLLTAVQWLDGLDRSTDEVAKAWHDTGTTTQEEDLRQHKAPTLPRAVTRKTYFPRRYWRPWRREICRQAQ